MTNELDLINAVNAKRARVSRIKDLIAKLQIKRNEAEAARDKAEDDYKKFMDDAGLKKSWPGIFECFCTYSDVVDIEDQNAVPDNYMRTRVSKEPDKNKIKADAEKLAGANWFKITRKRHLQIRAKKGE